MQILANRIFFGFDCNSRSSFWLSIDDLYPFQLPLHSSRSRSGPTASFPVTRAGPDVQAGLRAPGRWGRARELPGEDGDGGRSRRFGDEEAQAEMGGVAEGNGASDYVWKFNAKSVA
jgi:hypothetical protein